MNKTRTPICAVCLITNPKPMCGLSSMQPAAIDGGYSARLQLQRQVSLLQKWPELIPASPPGAYDGRAKWAEVDVLGRSPAGSVTTPSCGDDAHAESSHAITKASIPHNAAHLFTARSLLSTGTNATGGTRRLKPNETRHEKILRGKRSSRLVPHGRQLGRA
jgi:hypothetical protein